MNKIIASLLVVLILSLGYCSSTPEETKAAEPAPAPAPAKTPAKTPAKK